MQILEANLFEAMKSLQARASGKDPMSDVQRMFGYCLGMRIALTLVTEANKQNTFANMEAIFTLLKDNFAQMNREKMKDYAKNSWPNLTVVEKP